MIKLECESKKKNITDVTWSNFYKIYRFSSTDESVYSNKMSDFISKLIKMLVTYASVCVFALRDCLQYFFV